MEEIAEIKRAKEIKAFLTDWGMEERDAKKIALQIVFKVEECPDFNQDNNSAKSGHDAIIRQLGQIKHAIGNSSGDYSQEMR